MNSEDQIKYLKAKNAYLKMQIKKQNSRSPAVQAKDIPQLAEEKSLRGKGKPRVARGRGKATV